MDIEREREGEARALDGFVDQLPAVGDDQAPREEEAEPEGDHYRPGSTTSGWMTVTANA